MEFQMAQFFISVFSNQKKNSSEFTSKDCIHEFRILLQNIKQLDDGDDDDDDAFVILASITNGFYDRTDCNGNGFIVFCVA